MFFRKSDTEKKIIAINNQLVTSFNNVKNDTTQIFQWIGYIYKMAQHQQQIIQNQQRIIEDINHKNNNQEQSIHDLELQLKYMPKSPEELKKIIDTYYSFEPIMNRIRELESRIEDIKISQQPIQSKVEHLHTKIERIPSKLSLKEKLIKRITKHSKDYIKNFILGLIRKYEKISALQLREIVVEEQGLCSKSSFYRILEEIEQEDTIGVIRKAKEKLYQFKAVKLPKH